MIRVTIAVPEAHIEAANELARCIGYTEADGLTYGEASWQDSEGNRYAVASTLAEASFVQAAASPLVEPPWGADMAAAAQAQAIVAVFGVAEDEGSPEAQPDRITAIVMDDPQAAIGMLRLVRVDQPET
ncbi:hypothetical protein [Gemmobacter sp.]|uniref:hypothetical protein n=1 Tax=Gemmobacter sp. TaxID=1898957 RepID=UPI002AFE5E2B|nr:hypothetical protein [Gemmobacter sp.]